MNGFSLLLAALTMGVDYGWQPASDGQMEYIVQIEPVTLIAMREGQEVVSQIDPQMRNARRFRIHVGTEMVPRRGNPPAQLPATGITAAQLPQAPGIQFGWQPISRDQLEFIVQIVPERMTTLRTGDDIVGVMPIDLPNVARIRVITGSAAIPRQGFQVASSQPLALGQPPANNGLSTAMIAPPRNTDPALNYGSGTAGQLGSNSNSWSSPNNANNSWSSAANPGIPNRDQGSLLLDQQRAAQRYQDPQANAQDWRSSGGTNTSTASAADPRFTSFPQVPPTQSLLDANRYRDGNYGYPPNATQSPYAATQSPYGATQPTYGTTQPPYGTTQPTYGTTQPTYGTTQPTYGTTQPTYGTTQPTYGTTQPSYGTAQSQLGGTNPAAANWNATSGRTNGTPQTQPGTGAPYSPAYGNADGSQGNFASPNNSGWPQQRVAGREGEQARTGVPGSVWPEYGQPVRDPNLKYPLTQVDLAKDRPWGALTVAVFLLFASIGGNLYLGWIAARIYRLYLDLADDLEDKERHDVTVEQPAGEDRWKERRKRRRAILGV